MPSEKELMERAGVSRATARKAISDLVYEGVLSTYQGRGTFTAVERVETALERPLGFTEAMTRLGRRPSTTVLSVDVRTSSAEVAAQLRVPPQTEVVVLERLRLLDGEPCMLERTHLPSSLVPGIAELDLGGSLYAVLESRYGLHPETGSEVIIALNADRKLAALLHVPIAAAILSTARTTEGTAGVPVEYTIRHARGDMCSFRVSLDGHSGLADHSLTSSMVTREAAYADHY